MGNTIDLFYFNGMLYIIKRLILHNRKSRCVRSMDVGNKRRFKNGFFSNACFATAKYDILMQRNTIPTRLLVSNFFVFQGTGKL